MLLSLLFHPPTDGIENNSGVNYEDQFLFLYSVSAKVQVMMRVDNSTITRRTHWRLTS